MKRGTKPQEHIGPWLTQYAILERLGVEQPVIVDGGAGTGRAVEFYLRMWKSPRIYCFEPNLPTMTLLQERYENNPRIHVYNKALGSRQESGRDFYVGGPSGIVSSLYPRAVGTRRYFGPKLTKGPKVDVTTLDIFAGAEGICHIDILHLDLQGGDYEALKGASKLLKGQGVSLVYTEVIFVPMYKAPLYLRTFNYLAGLKYTLHGLFHIRYAPVNRQLKYADALFVSPHAREEALDTLPVEYKRESRVHALGAPR